MFLSMAELIVNKAAIHKKTFTYIPPTLPAELIEPTNYKFNFTKLKFIHIGINPTVMFSVPVGKFNNCITL